jgi:hypothetical protein
MAYKKRKMKKVSRRRSSRRGIMGAVGKFDVIAPLAMVGGAVAGRYLANKVLEKNTADAKNLYKAGIQIGTGIVAQMFGKNPMLHNAGSGMIAAGGLTLVAHLVPKLGASIGADGGDADILVLSGTDMDISTLNGVDTIGADSIDINTLNGVDSIGADDDFEI